MTTETSDLMPKPSALWKVDGFRFDIMSCLMVSTMEKAKAALRALTPEVDGVDGSKIYLYGEGWDFGEVRRNVGL